MDTAYSTLINSFTKPSILVIGDLMIDTYLKGASTRLSPEAPVPVVNITSNVSVLGGGANTAINLHRLGAKVTFTGIVGVDSAGKMAAAMLENEGIRSRLISCNSRNTIVKTRVMSGNQLLTRYDEGTEYAIADDCEVRLIELLADSIHTYDAVVIADYDKGVITPGVISALQYMKIKMLAVDSKRLSRFKSLRPSLVKPNYQEIRQLLQLSDFDTDRVNLLSSMGQQIYAATGAAVTAVTLDEEGAVLFHKDQLICHTPAHPVSQPNVIGAGDTYISAFTMALLSGADICPAAEIAATAAAIAISKTNTAFCCKEELNAFFITNTKYLDDTDAIRDLCSVYRAQGKRIVFTNGCFDILHSGHVSYLTRARALGDVLIVGINTDDSIRRLKGSTRPINQLEDRMEVLGGLGAVDHIIPFGEEGDDTPVNLIRAIAPDIFTKGGDYSRDDLPEAPIVEELGGVVTIMPLVPDRSTTSLIRRIHIAPHLNIAQA